jgi:hypothetical protein
VTGIYKGRLVTNNEREDGKRRSSVRRQLKKQKLRSRSWCASMVAVELRLRGRCGALCRSRGDGEASGEADRCALRL